MKDLGAVPMPAGQPPCNTVHGQGYQAQGTIVGPTSPGAAGPQDPVTKSPNRAPIVKHEGGGSSVG